MSVVHIPAMTSREELSHRLTPLDNDRRVALFRSRLQLNEEELLKRQIEGERVRKLMLTLADVIIATRRRA